MIISARTLQSIQRAVSIEEVIAHFVPLKKRGQNLWACCPFHQERTPSFSVVPSKGFYKCFGCGSAGDAITFIQKMTHVSFAEAVAQLAERYGIEIEAEGEEAAKNGVQPYHEKESLRIILQLAKAYYVGLLWEDAEAAQVALPYLHQRNIVPKVAKQYELGYSLNQWDGLYKFAIQKGISVELLLKAGLVIKQDTRIYDRFRGRLMFPIHNAAGEVVAFAARQIGFSLENTPKYINSPETIIYHKGKLLYGLTLAKQAIKQAGNCYLVGGYTDVLAFYMADLPHVVAAAGTALTETQIECLRRFTQKVTLVFDGDQAGIDAVLRSIDKLLIQAFEVDVVLLPDGEDPDSYLRKVGKEGFIQYLNNAVQDFITFKVNFLFRPSVAKGEVEQAKCIRAIVQSIALIPDGIMRHLLFRKCSKLMAIEEEVVMAAYRLQYDKAQSMALWARKNKRTALHDIGSKHNHLAKQKDIPFASKLSLSIEAYERELMRILLTYGTTKLAAGTYLYEYIFAELGDMAFRSEKCRVLLDHFKQIIQEDGALSIKHSFLHHSAEHIKQMAIDFTASPHEISEEWVSRYGIYTAQEAQHVEQISLEVILRLKIRLIQEMIEQNREELARELSIEEENHFLQIHQLLKEAEYSIAKQLGTVVAQ